MGISWEKTEDKNCIGRKYIDLSMFKYGIHIPIDYREEFLNNIYENKIEMGMSQHIKLIFDDYIAECEIRNINSKARSETIQIRYDSNKKLKQYLEKTFKYTLNLLEEKSDEETNEYIEFFEGESINTFKLKINTHKNYRLTNDEELDDQAIKFIDTIKTQSMNKSYKIPTLLAFYNNGDMKLKISYEEIGKTLQDYYSIKIHRDDLDDSKDIESWEKNDHIRKAKETSMRYLPKEYFYDDRVNKQFCIVDSLYNYINNEGFVKEYKNSIDLLEGQYFKMGKKEQFILWLSENTKLSKSSIEKYSSAINKISQIYFNDNEYLYNIEAVENLDKEIEKLRENEEFNEKDIKGNRMYGNALKKLREYRNDNINSDYEESNNIMIEENRQPVTNKEALKNIQNYIQNQGYIYTYEQLSNLYLSLKTKPFVILAGISGTGKSKIVRLLAESLGATSQNNQFNMISVRPDWNDSTELIGYKNLEDKFIEGYLTKIIQKANENKNKPYFVCLDEMNLARVEYYLSDYLSIIESRKKVEQDIITDNLIEDETILKNTKLNIPDNIYLIGTVNMDDTTFQFSRKVLDRANTIEFSDVDLENLFEQNIDEDIQPLDVSNEFLKTTYLKTLHIEEDHREYAKTINKKIVQINEILKKSQKQFAYRVRDEILFYMIENKKSDLLDEDVAFDYQIMQKILPAITGSESSVEQVLIDLFNFICDKPVISGADIEEAENYLQKENVRYKNSAEKIIYMLKGYSNDGYVSYWY